MARFFPKAFEVVNRTFWSIVPGEPDKLSFTCRADVPQHIGTRTADPSDPDSLIIVTRKSTPGFPPFFQHDNRLPHSRTSVDVVCINFCSHLACLLSPPLSSFPRGQSMINPVYYERLPPSFAVQHGHFLTQGTCQGNSLY